MNSSISIVKNIYKNESNNIMLHLFRWKVGQSLSSPSRFRDLENIFVEWATCSWTISSQNG